MNDYNDDKLIESYHFPRHFVILSTTIDTNKFYMIPLYCVHGNDLKSISTREKKLNDKSNLTLQDAVKKRNDNKACIFELKPSHISLLYEKFYDAIYISNCKKSVKFRYLYQAKSINYLSQLSPPYCSISVNGEEGLTQLFLFQDN
uniref:Uncharacterized protein n=1 Tax=Onchocerca volvulus TaxID=6282 RepID=A0A8R1TVV4_ONCVO